MSTTAAESGPGEAAAGAGSGRAAAGAEPGQAAGRTGGSANDPDVAANGRRLRKDAERNRQKILAAAGEVFTERGLQATLDDVARQAGVGVGTVYRRFPDKEALVEALFTERLDTLVGYAEQGLAEPDPWTGLVFLLEHAATVIAGDRGLRQILMFATYGRDRVDQARQRLLPVVLKLVQRAQEAGQVRADLRPTDVPLIEFMLSMAAEYAGQVRPELWRRYLALILDALRPARTGTDRAARARAQPGRDGAGHAFWLLLTALTGCSWPKRAACPGGPSLQARRLRRGGRPVSKQVLLLTLAPAFAERRWAILPLPVMRSGSGTGGRRSREAAAVYCPSSRPRARSACAWPR